MMITQSLILFLRLDTSGKNTYGRWHHVVEFNPEVFGQRKTVLQGHYGGFCTSEGYYCLKASVMKYLYSSSEMNSWFSCYFHPDICVTCPGKNTQLMFKTPRGIVTSATVIFVSTFSYEFSEIKKQILFHLLYGDIQTVPWHSGVLDSSAKPLAKLYIVAYSINTCVNCFVCLFFKLGLNAVLK